MSSYFRVLTIAGSDSGGGAGIQADLKTFSALGCYGMSAITALTAQNTVGVQGIYPVESSFVSQQIESVIDDIGVDAVKIGMLGTPELIETVANQLKKFNVKNIVLDPVMVAKSGDRLLDDSAIQAIITHLFPLARVVTPNQMEAKVITGIDINTKEDMLNAAAKLLEYGCESVILKGTFFMNDLLPDLYMNHKMEVEWLETRRIATKNNHGSGCTLSSAIAANLAKGSGTKQSVLLGKKYISEALRAGTYMCIGKGKSPVNHFYNLWKPT